MSATGLAHQATPISKVLESVPRAWATRRLKEVTTINSESLPDETDPDFAFRYIDIGSVDNLGRIRTTEDLVFGEAPSRARRLVNPGDSIVSTVRTYLRSIAQIPEQAQDLIVSTGFATLTPDSSLLPRYLYWWLRASPFVEEVVARSVGVSYPAVNPSDIGDIAILIPEIDEQRRIVEFLDSETASIDALATEQLNTRSLLVERLWSLFIERVSRPSATQVPLRRVLTRLSDGPFGSAFTSAEYSDDGAAVVRLGNIGFAEYRHTDQAHVPLDLFKRFQRHEVHQGDLLIAGLGDERNHAGRACVSPDLGPAMVKGKCFVATVNQRLASADYLAFFLSSALGRDAVGEAARGSTRTMINLEITKATLVLLPELTDQLTLVKEVQRERSQLDSLVEEIDIQVALLREHRQALITAAVTGQLDSPRSAA